MGKAAARGQTGSDPRGKRRAIYKKSPRYATVFFPLLLQTQVDSLSNKDQQLFEPSVNAEKNSFLCSFQGFGCRNSTSTLSSFEFERKLGYLSLHYLLPEPDAGHFPRPATNSNKQKAF